MDLIPLLLEVGMRYLRISSFITLLTPRSLIRFSSASDSKQTVGSAPCVHDSVTLCISISPNTSSSATNAPTRLDLLVHQFHLVHQTVNAVLVKPISQHLLQRLLDGLVDSLHLHALIDSTASQTQEAVLAERVVATSHLVAMQLPLQGTQQLDQVRLHQVLVERRRLSSAQQDRKDLESGHVAVIACEIARKHLHVVPLLRLLRVVHRTGERLANQR